MTAGSFRLGALRVVEGESQSIVVNGFKGFAKNLFYRLTGQIDQSDLKRGRLSGSASLNQDLEATIKIRFDEDARKEGSEKVGIELSLDKAFRDPTIQFNSQGSNPLFFKVLDTPTVKTDLITGIQDTSGDIGPKADDLTIGLFSESSWSRFGAYFMEFKPDLQSFDVYGDSNRNGQFDKGDKTLGEFKVAPTAANLGGFRNEVTRTFEYRQSTGDFLLKYGGQVYFRAEGDGGLF